MINDSGQGKEQGDRPLPLLMVDVVLLTLVSGQLCAGLTLRSQENEPYFGAWCLPGGYVHPQEDMDAQDTARRVLRDKAGVSSPYLEQLITMTGAARDPRGWSASIVYYALVPEHIAPQSSERFRWEPADDLMRRTLPFDHTSMLRVAIERVRSKTSYSALPIHLMPEEFTLSQLRSVYEQILGGKLEPRSFVRRMQEMDVLQETGKTRTEAHRPARMYRLKSDRSMALLGPSLLIK